MHNTVRIVAHRKCLTKVEMCTLAVIPADGRCVEAKVELLKF